MFAHSLTADTREGARRFITPEDPATECILLPANAVVRVLDSVCVVIHHEKEAASLPAPTPVPQRAHIWYLPWPWLPTPCCFMLNLTAAATAATARKLKPYCCRCSCCCSYSCGYGVVTAACLEYAKHLPAASAAASAVEPRITWATQVAAHAHKHAQVMDARGNSIHLRPAYCSQILPPILHVPHTIHELLHAAALSVT